MYRAQNYLEKSSRNGGCYWLYERLLWRIQDFPRGVDPLGAWTPLWALFDENYAKMKESGPVGGGVHPAPPQIRQWVG